MVLLTLLNTALLFIVAIVTVIEAIRLVGSLLVTREGGLGLLPTYPLLQLSSDKTINQITRLICQRARFE
jgi:hypothetical protein